MGKRDKKKSEQKKFTAAKSTAEVMAKAPSENPAQSTQLSSSLAKSLVGVAMDLPQALSSGKMITYVNGKQGHLYEVRKTALGHFVTRTDSPVGFEDIKEGWLPALPKVPYKLLAETVSFFRWVAREYRNDEAVVQIFYSAGRYFLHLPEQVTSTTSARFARNSSVERDVDNILVADIHSHNDMGAFWSGTDMADEVETRLYGVIGKVHSELPEHKWKSVSGRKAVDLNISEIFEMPTMKWSFDNFEKEHAILKEMLKFPDVTFPAEWKTMFREWKRNAPAISANRHGAGRGVEIGWDRDEKKPQSRSYAFDRDSFLFNEGVEQLEFGGGKSFDSSKYYQDLSAKKNYQQKIEVDSRTYRPDAQVSRQFPQEPALSKVEALAASAVNLKKLEFQEFIGLIAEQGLSQMMLREILLVSTSGEELTASLEAIVEEAGEEVLAEAILSMEVGALAAEVAKRAPLSSGFSEQDATDVLTSLLEAKYGNAIVDAASELA